MTDKEALTVEIKLNVSMENEGTDSPWWLIVDPQQMMEPDPAFVAMGMITGPFFSREEAQAELTHRRYHYGKHAVVWCASGCYTKEYKKAYYEGMEMQTEHILMLRKN